MTVEAFVEYFAAFSPIIGVVLVVSVAAIMIRWARGTARW